MPGPHHFDTDILRAALIGLEHRRSELDSIIGEIRGRMKGNRAPVVAPAEEKPRMSAAGRRRIAEAQKKRWADFHEEKLKAARRKRVAKRQRRVATVKPVPEAVAPPIVTPPAVEPPAEPVMQAQTAVTGGD